MRIIKDLLEVYTHYIKLPLSFIKFSGEIEYSQDYHSILKRVQGIETHVKEVARFIEYIKSPTIIEVNDPFYQNKPHYIVTPIFFSETEKYYVLAGPFSTKNRIHTHEPFDYFTEDQQDEFIRKMNNLHYFIRNNEKIEAAPSKSQQYFLVLEEILHLNISEYEPLDYIDFVLTNVLRMQQIDFLGLALVNEQGIFEVKLTKGERIDLLKYKTFFVDETILGQAITSKEAVYWNVSQPSEPLAFFYEHQIVPNNLLAIPVHVNDGIEGVLFAGNYSSYPLDKSLEDFFHILLRNFNNFCLLEKAVFNENRLNRLLSLLNEILNIKIYQPDNYVLENIIFDVLKEAGTNCEIIYTTLSGRVYKSASVSELTETAHLKIFNKLLSRNVSFEKEYTHGYLENFGYYTIRLTNKEMTQSFLSVLNILHNMLFNFEERTNRLSVFDHSLLTVKQLNKEFYQITERLVERIMIHRGSHNFDQQLVTNLVKIMSFPKEYISNKIKDLQEIHVFNESNELLELKLPINECRYESKLFAFIYNEYILKNKDNIWIFGNLFEEFKVKVETITQPKDFNEVIEQLKITTREKEVLHLILRGLNNIEAAEALSISTHTIKNHVTNILKKLEVADRVQLMAKIINMQT